MSEATVEKIVFYGTALAMLLLCLLLIKIINIILGKILKKSKIDTAVHVFIIRLLDVILIILIVIAVLSYLGVPAAPFVAAVGACGAVLALALKDSLSNVAGGIMILINKPFGRDDYVKIGEYEGSVQEIDLMVTYLKTVDNKIIIAPNGTLNTTVLINYSKENLRRVDCIFSIGYDSDVLLAKQVMRRVAEKGNTILLEPAPLIEVKDHNESSIDMIFDVWCKTEDYWETRYYIQESVKLAFDEAGISIPYPQVDVHLDKL